MSRIALVAGAGGLPAALVAAMAAPPLVCAVEGVLPGGLVPDQTFRVERLVPFLRWLAAQGVDRLAFAGAMRRPRLDPALFDPDTAQLVPRLLAAMQAGDDATLREVLAIFEDAGFTILGVEDLAPALLPPPGVIEGAPGPREEEDAARAALIVAALGAVDVGQACVVAQGACLAVEALPGTDAMLASVAGLDPTLRPDPARGRGLLYKAAKPGQDRRIDLPTIGPDTLRRVAEAGLAGLVIEAGGVICLDLPACRAIAREKGLFLWAR